MVAERFGAARSAESLTTSARAGENEGFELVSISSGGDRDHQCDWKRIAIQLISLGKIRGYWSELGRWLCAIKKQGQLAIKDILDGNARGGRQKARGARAGEHSA
eukprot:964597-Pyramimonas_sp.AAC.1